MFPGKESLSDFFPEGNPQNEQTRTAEQQIVVSHTQNYLQK